MPFLESDVENHESVQLAEKGGRERIRKRLSSANSPACSSDVFVPPPFFHALASSILYEFGKDENFLIATGDTSLEENAKHKCSVAADLFRKINVEKLHTALSNFFVFHHSRFSGAAICPLFFNAYETLTTLNPIFSRSTAMKNRIGVFA